MKLSCCCLCGGDRGKSYIDVNTRAALSSSYSRDPKEGDDVATKKNKRVCGGRKPPTTIQIDRGGDISAIQEDDRVVETWREVGPPTLVESSLLLSHRLVLSEEALRWWQQQSGGGSGQSLQGTASTTTTAVSPTPSSPLRRPSQASGTRPSVSPFRSASSGAIVDDTTTPLRDLESSSPEPYNSPAALEPSTSLPYDLRNVSIVDDESHVSTLVVDPTKPGCWDGMATLASIEMEPKHAVAPSLQAQPSSRSMERVADEDCGGDDAMPSSPRTTRSVSPLRARRRRNSFQDEQGANLTSLSLSPARRLLCFSADQLQQKQFDRDRNASVRDVVRMATTPATAANANDVPSFPRITALHHAIDSFESAELDALVDALKEKEQLDALQRAELREKHKLDAAAEDGAADDQVVVAATAAALAIVRQASPPRNSKSAPRSRSVSPKRAAKSAPRARQSFPPEQLSKSPNAARGSSDKDGLQATTQQMLASTSHHRRTPSPRRMRKSLSSYDNRGISVISKISCHASTFTDQLDSSRWSKALSDIPSDVDSGVRERYLTACRLLKATLIEKEKKLLPPERDFLKSLVSVDENHEPQTLSEPQVAAIETASETLLSDPLFQDDSVLSSQFPLGNLDSAPVSGIKVNSLSLAIAAAPSKAGGESASLISMAPSNKSDQTVQITNARIRRTLSRLLQDVESDDDDAKADNQTFPVVPSDYSVAGAFDHKEHYSFVVLGLENGYIPRILTPAMMEALRGFFPSAIVKGNFWLKFALGRDGASLTTLLSRIRMSKYTLVAVLTTEGCVFGSFCSSSWRVRPSWYGSSDSFLWRQKECRKRRSERALCNPKQASPLDREMEVYPFTGHDDFVQYCSKRTIAVGGGDWHEKQRLLPDGLSQRHGDALGDIEDAREVNPYHGEEPTGIGLMIDGDLMGGESNCCATFANPGLCKTRTSTSKNNNEFEVLALEVWSVTAARTVPDAEYMEMHQHFIEEKRAIAS